MTGMPKKRRPLRYFERLPDMPSAQVQQQSIFFDDGTSEKTPASPLKLPTQKATKKRVTFAKDFMPPASKQADNRFLLQKPPSALKKKALLSRPTSLVKGQAKSSLPTSTKNNSVDQTESTSPNHLPLPEKQSALIDAASSDTVLRTKKKKKKKISNKSVTVSNKSVTVTAAPQKDATVKKQIPPVLQKQARPQKQALPVPPRKVIAARIGVKKTQAKPVPVPKKGKATIVVKGKGKSLIGRGKAGDPKQVERIPSIECVSSSSSSSEEEEQKETVTGGVKTTRKDVKEALPSGDKIESKVTRTNDDKTKVSTGKEKSSDVAKKTSEIETNLSGDLIVENLEEGNALCSGKAFEDLSDVLTSTLRRQLAFLKFKLLTRIQAEAIPVLAQSPPVDGLIKSTTGSGKTLAFLIPAINSVLKSVEQKDKGKTLIDRKDGTRIIILSPTRELAVQTHGVALKLAQIYPWMTTTLLVGGAKRKSEKASLRKGAVVLLATPGRLMDHLDSTASFRCPHLQTVVMDEVDRLMDMGFEPLLRRIVQALRSNMLSPIATAALPTERTIKLTGGNIAVEREVQRALLKELTSGRAAPDNLKRKKGLIDDDEDDTEVSFKLPGETLKIEEELNPLADQMSSTATSTVPTSRHKKIRLETVADEATSSSSTDQSSSDNLCSAKDFQTILVSATLTPDIEKLANFVLRPGFVWLGHDKEAGSMPANDSFNVPDSLKQAYVKISNIKWRLMTLFALLRMRTTTPKSKTVVFLNDCDSVNYIHALIESLRWPTPPGPKRTAVNAEAKKTMEKVMTSVEDILFDEEDVFGASQIHAFDSTQSLFSADKVFADIQAFKLHGSMSVEDRLGNLKDFNAARDPAVLFTSDVAARGMNFPSAVDLIIQLDPPLELTDYVHRVGRTARLGRPGTSLIFLTEDEVPFVDLLHQHGVLSKGIKETPQSTLIKVFQPQTVRNNTIKTHLPSELKNLRESDAVSYLLSRFTMLVEEDNALSSMAQKAFLSYVKGYRVYSGEMRRCFDSSKLHLGHVAGSFLIKKSPRDISGASRPEVRGQWKRGTSGRRTR